jgi:hypothetical protein
MNARIPEMAAFLRSVPIALALAVAGCVGDGGSSSSYGQENESATAPTSLPVTIKNRSGRTVYVNITGDASQPFSVAPATTATIDTNTSATFNVAQLSAGRIYLSYDKALSSNAPDGANPADPDYRTRFDKIELTYSQGVGGKANLTAVDFYAIPLLLETSIQGTVIEHLTLATGQSGHGLRTAITNLIGAANEDKAVVKSTSTPVEVVRVLSPVKRPAAYGSFDAFLGTLENSSTFDIAGTYFGATSQHYHYTGAFDGTEIKLSNGTHKIVVSRASLAYSATDLIDHNGIYTCNAPFTVDGIPHAVADNDIYAAVYRDLVTGFNLGFVTTGANTSSAWWNSPAFPPNPDGDYYYNAYAKVLANNYPGAYGFPFSDRYKQVLADLGGKIDELTITVLADDTAVPPYSPQGNINPQSGPAGSPTFNVSLVTSDSNFNLTTFTFDTQSYQGGNGYNFPTAPSPFSVPSTSAVINNVPTQDGMNIYTLELRGRRYSVLAKVSNGVVTWASIAGGGSATYTAPTLFVGGLD